MRQKLRKLTLIKGCALQIFRGRWWYRIMNIFHEFWEGQNNQILLNLCILLISDKFHSVWPDSVPSYLLFIGKYEIFCDYSPLIKIKIRRFHPQNMNFGQMVRFSHAFKVQTIPKLNDGRNSWLIIGKWLQKIVE